MFSPRQLVRGGMALLIWSAAGLLGATPALAEAKAKAEAGAEVEPKPLVFFAGLAADRDGGEGVRLGIDYGVAEKTWVTAIGTYTHLSDELSDITTRSLGAGIEHSFGRFGVSGNVAYWGDPDEVDSTSFRSSLFYKGGPWRVALSGERREVDVTFRFTNADDIRVQRTEQLQVDALGGSVSYSGEPWSVRLGHAGYEYSRDPRALNFLFRFSVLSASGLTLANSFLEYRSWAGLEYAFGDRGVFLELSADKGAVDELRTNTFMLGYYMPIAERWDMEFQLGVADTEVLGGAVFGGVTFFLFR